MYQRRCLYLNIADTVLMSSKIVYNGSMILQEVEDIIQDNNIRIDIKILNRNQSDLVNHIRLQNDYGKPILDIYFKYNKKREVLRNTYFIHKTEAWGVIKDEGNLVNLLKDINTINI